MQSRLLKAVLGPIVFIYCVHAPSKRPTGNNYGTNLRIRPRRRRLSMLLFTCQSIWRGNRSTWFKWMFWNSSPSSRSLVNDPDHSARSPWYIVSCGPRKDPTRPQMFWSWTLDQGLWLSWRFLCGAWGRLVYATHVDRNQLLAFMKHLPD